MKRHKVFFLGDKTLKQKLASSIGASENVSVVELTPNITIDVHETTWRISRASAVIICINSNEAPAQEQPRGIPSHAIVGIVSDHLVEKPAWCDFTFTIGTESDMNDFQRNLVTFLEFATAASDNEDGAEDDRTCCCC